MLERAIQGERELQISTVEIDRGGVSFTAETLAAIRSERPEDELLLLMGSDALVDLPRWYRPELVCQLAIPAVVHRAGSAVVDFEPMRTLVTEDRLQEIQSHQVEMPATEISSSQIRALIASGGPWESMVPAPVASYIDDNQLYRNGHR